jgi:hypothetical protein
MGKLHNTIVYLAGPVEVADDPVSWRDSIRPGLNNLGCRVWDPLVKPEWFVDTLGCEYGVNDQLFDKKALRQRDVWGDDPEFNKSLERVDFIRKVCLRLVSAADFIICKVGGHTVGTFEEICSVSNKPILFMGDFDSSWRHSQFYNGDKLFFEDEGHILGYLEKINNGDTIPDPLNWVFLEGNWPS